MANIMKIYCFFAVVRRYCMAVSILGFMYSLAQALDVAYHLSTDKYSNQHSQLRYYIDFFMDQVSQVFN